MLTAPKVLWGQAPVLLMLQLRCTVDILIKVTSSEVDVGMEVAPLFVFRPILAPITSLKLETELPEYFSKSTF